MPAVRDINLFSVPAGVYKGGKPGETTPVDILCGGKQRDAERPNCEASAREGRSDAQHQGQEPKAVGVQHSLARQQVLPVRAEK